MHAEAATGREEVVNLWVRPPEAGVRVEEGLNRGNMHLGILLAYRLARGWKAQLNIIAVVDTPELTATAERYIDELRDLTRMPASAQTMIMSGSFLDCLRDAPQSDMDVLGVPRRPEGVQFMRQCIEVSRSSCLFTQDSGTESALV